MNKITALGPGKTCLDYTPSSGEKVLAFQEVFPHCISHLGVVPDYWFGSDPNSYLEGLQFLLANIGKIKKDIQIMVPEPFFEDISIYRKSFGTTPLMRQPGAWNFFQKLLLETEKYYTVIKLPVITTKFLSLHWRQYPDLDGLFLEDHIRFMSEKPIFGTVEFDSETVSGELYKWGLESKLTSSVLPMCYYLRASLVKLYGFDFQGPRFYSEDARHPWNDETQQKNKNIVEYSLNLLKKWIEWECIHGMKIVTGTKNKISLPNQFLEFQ